MKKRVLSFLLIFLLAFPALSACGKGETSESYWAINAKSTSDGEFLQYYAVLKVPANSEKKINEIWVNVGDMAEESVKFNLAFGSSSADSSLRNAKQSDLTVSNRVAKDADGWVRLCDDLSLTYSYALVTTSDTMKFYEIIFLTEDHEVLKATVQEAGERNSSVHTTGRIYDLDNVDGEPYAHFADKIADEQDAFSFEKVSNLYEKSVIRNSSQSEEIQ